MKLERGDRVDRYEVERLLGAGGTALVYKVRHVGLGTYHALKLLTISGESIRTRLMQEGRAQATLDHLNIVAVTDILDVAGQPGLLMEYVEGPTLEDALTDHVLSLRDTETLFRGVLGGVRAAHRLGIVHRDLKPANVLLDPTADGYVPKVTDFGLAKAVRGASGRKTKTRQGVAMGTPSYMAPEQIRDAGTVDERADIFSLGCVLYELLARQRAFGGDDVLEIYTRIASGHYAPINSIVPDLPERIVIAIQGCLQVDRSHRIPDCDTLEEVLLGMRTWRWARPPTPPPDLAPPPSLRSDAPPLTLAPRDVDATPAPISRVHGPPSPVSWVVPAGMLGMALAVLFVALLIALVGISVPIYYNRQLEQRTTVEIKGSSRLPMQPLPLPAPPVPVAEPLVDPEPVVDPEPASPRPRPVATPRPAARLHTIKLISRPSLARIHVDGAYVQKRTNNKIELAPGTHRIELRSDLGNGVFTVTAGAGRPEMYCYDFATGTRHTGRCP